MNTNPTQFTRREVILRAAEIYRQSHQGADGRVPATFQIVWLTGWAPDASQQQAARPGSATVRLTDALRIDGEGGEGSQQG